MRLRTPMAVVLCALAGATAAQTPAATVVVTGNPLGRDSLAQPVDSLAGERLLLGRGTTLGETLDRLPGVAGSGFGPNASRPVIRGLDGDRVRLLDNGGPAVDASSLSADHAPALDPLVAERIELLRGPAALLYGGNATGGVVNVIDQRIPKAVPTGLGGRAELRLGGAAGGRSGAVVLDGGGGALAWHADAFGRRLHDLRVPRFVPVEAGEPLAASERVRNSAARAHGGAVGAAWIGSDARFGASVDTLRHDYGVTVEPDVTIRLERERLALEGAWVPRAGSIESLDLAASHTRYRHQEVEGDGHVGTTFRSRGQDLRLQARHRALGAWRGVIGVQVERLDFAALGDEAFVPPTRTRSAALFVLEQSRWGAVELQAGVRTEQIAVARSADADAARFGAPMTRRFRPLSGSFGATWRIDDALALGATLGHTERAPAYHELYADGLHVATGAYERGDLTLGVERSRDLGLTLEWRRGAQRVKASAFDTRFARYLALRASAASVDTDDGEAVPEYRVEGVAARLRGFELDARWRVVNAPWRVDLGLQADAVRGTDRTHGEPLPRLAPHRVGLTLEATGDAWSAGIGGRRSARQDRVSSGDTATPGHTLWNAWASWRTGLLGAGVTAFARLDNLTDRLAYNAASAPTVRALSPLAGRALTVGLRVDL